MSRFYWIAYALAIAVWNTIFTGVLVGVLNIIYCYIGHALLGKVDIILMYIAGYITLFLLNTKIIDDDL